MKSAWKEHTEHAFVAGLGDGTLPVESFKYYLIQDYLYLVREYMTLLEGANADMNRFNLLARLLLVLTRPKQWRILLL